MRDHNRCVPLLGLFWGKSVELLILDSKGGNDGRRYFLNRLTYTSMNEKLLLKPRIHWQLFFQNMASKKKIMLCICIIY